MSYFLQKDQDTKETIYIDYEKIDGYQFNPKKSYEDGIKVNKLVIVKPSFYEKILKKKIKKEILDLYKLAQTIDDTDNSDTGIRETLLRAERLKLNIINKYLFYLGKEFAGLSLNKLQIVIEELRVKLYNNLMLKQNGYYNDESSKGRGR